MQTKFDVGEKVYIAGEILSVTSSNLGTYYKIQICEEKHTHEIVLKEDDEDLIKLPSSSAVFET